MDAIIGGSGIYDLQGVSWKQEISLETPFGSPSGPIRNGEIEGRPFFFLPRHGVSHQVSPSALNYRANIFALKSLGVTRIYSLSAVGSLRQDIEPTHIVVPDQFVDRTRHRVDSFFKEGIVAHVSMADPFCPHLRKAVVAEARSLNLSVHDGGTYVCMEGPQFSTKAESHLYRSWGMDIIGMTNLTEARLAREAEICYVTIALSTDYDCWHPDHGHVTVDAIMETLRANGESANRLAASLLAKDPPPRDCACGSSLRYAFITPKDSWPKDLAGELKPLLNDHLN